jgi:hypothetical protein
LHDLGCLGRWIDGADLRFWNTYIGAAGGQGGAGIADLRL